MRRLFGAAILFSLIEVSVFHSGLYSSILEPGSSAGMAQAMLWNERHRSRLNENQVIAVGDSRMDLTAKIANEQAGTSYTFATIATPGTTPRCWYYMLRDLDPNARNYSAIVIAVNDYDDEDWEDLADRILDLYFLVPLLRVDDAATFSWSFPSWPNRWEAFRGVLLKGWTYRRDFQALLSTYKFRRRMTDVKWMREEYAKVLYNHLPGNENLRGLSVDWNARKIIFPEGQTASQRRSLEDILLRGTTVQTGKRADYGRAWFGRIVQRYRGSRTRLIFIRLPRGPVVRPYHVAQSSSIREFASRGEVTLANEHLFDELERPEMFKDALHMNGPGSERFSFLVASEVQRILGAPAANR